MKIRTLCGVGVIGAILMLQIAGCPTGTVPPEEFIEGGTGDTSRLAEQATVTVLSPQSNLAFTGGTPVEVNWRALASTRFASVDVFFDVDQNPDNDNEIVSQAGLALTETRALLDTSDLRADTYFIGVLVRELGVLAAADYAPGTVRINQRPQLFFDSPRDNFALDRTALVTRRFDVAWTLFDPDSTVSTRILLDPDSTPNGNEVLLRQSSSQTGDRFSFDLPTGNFQAGTYRILAIVSDGSQEFSFYAPASIAIRSRLAGVHDLRDLALPSSSLQGAIFQGFNPRDNAGSFVGSASDIDGDGFRDFIILAQFAKPQYTVNIQRTGVGEAYLIYGRRERFSGLINLNSTGTLFRGEVYGGPPEAFDPVRPSRGISSFAALSDWDGDGVRELAFGMPFTDSLSIQSVVGRGGAAPLDTDGYFRSGVVVIAAGSTLRPDLGFPGRNVFSLSEFGTLVHTQRSCGLCIDNDACQCLEGFHGPKAPIIAACRDTKFHLHWPISLAGAPNEGSVRLGCRFSSADSGDGFGETISAYDFDGLIMSAPNRDPLVSSFQLQNGVPGGGVTSIFFCDVADGFFPWTGVQSPPASGDYPGTPDGATGSLPHGGPYHYIVDDYRTGPTPVGTLELSPGFWVDADDGDPCIPTIDENVAFPENSTRFWSGRPGARLSNVQGVDDVNGDGLFDMLIGAPFAQEGAGATYIVLGRIRNLMRGGELRIEELDLPANSSNPNGRRIFDGIRIVGAPGTRLGQSQDAAGDFNGDGFPDVVIGSPLVNARRGGVAVFFGSKDVINLTDDEISFDAIAQRGLGVILSGDAEGDLAGARVSGAGDVDGDGLGDILIAAPERSVRVDANFDGVAEIDRTRCGVVYLVYGSSKLTGTISLADIGTEALPGAVFIGRNSGDTLGAGLGEQGDRSTGIAPAGDVDGDGRTDLLFSAVGASPRERVAAGEAYLIYGTGD